MVISTEKAIDVLPYAVDIFEKIKLDKYIKDTRKKHQGKKVDEVAVGIDLFKYVLKHLATVKEDLFTLLSIIDEKSVQEIREQPIPVTIARVRELMNDEELISLFKSAM